MFENGNIQSRPLPQLYQTTELSTRTWNVPVSINSSLSDVDYTLIVVNGNEITPGLSTLQAGLDSVEYMSTTFEGGENSETAALLAGLSTAEYELLVVSYSNGDPAEDNAALKAGLSSAAYDLIVFDSTVTPVKSLTLSSGLESASYELT